MSKLRPFMGPPKKKGPKYDRLTEEERSLGDLVQQTRETSTLSSATQLMVEIQMAQYKRQGEIIRHLQEIEGRAHRGR